MVDPAVSKLSTRIFSVFSFFFHFLIVQFPSFCIVYSFRVSLYVALRVSFILIDINKVLWSASFLFPFTLRWPFSFTITV